MIASFCHITNCISHPALPCSCIVGLIGLGATDAFTNETLRDTFYLVEELVSGGSLRRIVLHQMIHHPLQLYRVQVGQQQRINRHGTADDSMTQL